LPNALSGDSDAASRSKIPYLDGLRGYSILTVVVSHWLLSVQTPVWLIPAKLMFGNGVLGVNIFFSISGFLITTLMLREWQHTGTISLRAFYERRIARIFPAAYAYVAAIAVLTIAGVVQLHWGAFLAAGLFGWNYGTLLNLFAESRDAQVFNHFWSLSLEEQFYLFWPGCLLLFGRPRSRMLAVGVVAAVPFIRLASYVLFPKSRYQLTAMFHTGVDQIFWGALVALAYERGIHLKWAGKRWFGWLTLGYALITIFAVAGAAERFHAIERFITPTVYSSFASLLLMWLLSGRTGVVRAALEWKPLRWVGLLSYSLYVWQQLFLATQSPLWTPFPLNMGCAFLAAIISYYLIESPLRTKIRAFFKQ
jgi:peptidoglycan/LPS O-acetylase OafA/YrhL